VPGYFDLGNLNILLGDMEERVGNLFGKIEFFECRLTVNNKVFKNGMKRPVFFEYQIFKGSSRLAGLLCNKAYPLSCFALVLPLTDFFASLVFVDVF
jgi:hypothetical protein